MTPAMIPGATLPMPTKPMGMSAKRYVNVAPTLGGRTARASMPRRVLPRTTAMVRS